MTTMGVEDPHDKFENGNILRVVVAEASGVNGSRPIPQLIDPGNEVVGTPTLTRTLIVWTEFKNPT